MDIPTNDDGQFEIIDESGTVHGRGTVRDDGQLVFEHIGGIGDQRVQMPVDEWKATWERLPQAQHLTLRAAETSE